MSKKAVSLNERIERVRRAIYSAAYSNQALVEDFYVEHVYDGYAIIRDYPEGQYWRVDYLETETGVQVQSPAEWVRVEQEWSLKSLVVAQNNHALKALGNGKVGGYLVVFSDPEQPDLTGIDYFDASTNFDIEDGAKTAVYYQHGLDDTLKRRKLGNGTLKVDDVGVWLEAQLELRDEYEKAVYGLVEAGKCGLSSGTAAHLVEREPVGGAMHIKYWPLGLDASITPTPCEPRTSVLPLKSLIESTTPQTTSQAAGDAATKTGAASEIQPQSTHKESSNMEENETQQPATVETLQNDIKALRQLIENSPAIKSAGVSVPAPVKNVGEKAIEEYDSLIDVLIDIKSGKISPDQKSAKAMTSSTGSNAGYLIPDRFLPVDEKRQGEYGVQDAVTTITDAQMEQVQLTRPTLGGGDLADAAGIAQNTARSSGDLGFERATRAMLTLAAPIVQISNQMIRRGGGSAAEQKVRNAFQRSLRRGREGWIISGSGSGQNPTGILTETGVGLRSGAALTTAAALIDAVQDAKVAMEVLGYNADTVSMRPEQASAIIKAKDSANNYITRAVQYDANGLLTIWGLKVAKSIAFATNLGAGTNETRVIVGEFGLGEYYRTGVYVDFSEHFAFDKSLVTFRCEEEATFQVWEHPKAFYVIPVLNTVA